MATRENREDRTVRLSVLDRLIDREPKESMDPARDWSRSVHEHKMAVLRDLEWLLNTRRIMHEASDDFPELQRSVFAYGPPDISSMSGDSPSVRRRLLRHLEELIRTFEPRLANVRVSMAEDGGSKAKQVRFVVEGLLRMDPDPERVSFDTVLEISSGRFLLKGDGGA